MSQISIFENEKFHCNVWNDFARFKSLVFHVFVWYFYILSSKFPTFLFFLLCSCISFSICFVLSSIVTVILLSFLQPSLFFLHSLVFFCICFLLSFIVSFTLLWAFFYQFFSSPKVMSHTQCFFKSFVV